MASGAGSRCRELALSLDELVEEPLRCFRTAEEPELRIGIFVDGTVGQGELQLTDPHMHQGLERPVLDPDLDTVDLDLARIRQIDALHVAYASQVHDDVWGKGVVPPTQ